MTELKPKTINYLNTIANQTQNLLAQAVEYRAKIASAKTSTAKSLYSNKLRKIVSKLDKHMALFSAIEQANKAKAEQQTSEQEQVEHVQKEVKE